MLPWLPGMAELLELASYTTKLEWAYREDLCLCEGNTELGRVLERETESNR